MQRIKGEAMPRGSKPGERRGGRQHATPNRRTVLTDRILAAAAANSSGSAEEMRQVLAADIAKWAKLVKEKHITFEQ